MKAYPKIGMRVRVKSINIKGVIDYVDERIIHEDHFKPIQLVLDKPYDSSGQRMFRTHLDDLVKLKKKENFDEEIF